MTMRRRFVVASVLVVVATAAFLHGSGLGSSAVVARAAQEIPAGLADAIHARLGSARSAKAPWLGYSIALSADGTTALVGAPPVDGNRGAAYVFHVSDAGSWASTETPMAALTHTSGGTEQFGYDVALSADGTTAFVSAPDAPPAYPYGGAIYVFHVPSEDAWATSATPTATLTVAQGFVGISLAASADGTTLVAGAPFYDVAQAGGAFVFHASSEDAWATTSTPTATLSYANESRLDQNAGWTVAISGDGTTALLADSSNPHGGAAWLYHVSAEDSWTTSTTPTAILTNGDGYPGALDVSLSDDGTVALLTHYSTWAVDVFHASGAAAWASTSTPTATLTNAAGTLSDDFGITAAVSADGTTALVTGDVHVPGTVWGYTGAAYVFHVAGEGAWASSSAPTATLATSPAYPAALSAEGTTALVGTPGARWENGAADVFHVSDPSSWASSSTPTAILTNSAIEICVVPRLVGKTLAGAKSALKARSCRLGKVGRVPRSWGKKGRVVSQNRRPRTHLPHGAKIGIKVAG